MKTDNFSYSTPLITSPFNASVESSTVLTRVDKSVRDIEYPLIQGYNLYLVIYFPQGVTDKRIHFTGNNAYKLYRKLYPGANPILYGPNPSLIEGALKAGWGVFVVNVADPAATHANFTVEFEFKKSPKKRKIYVRKTLANPNKLAMIWLNGDAGDTQKKADFDTRDDIDPAESSYEIEFDTFEMGFKQSFIKGITKDTDLDKLLSLSPELNKYNMTSGDTISADDKGRLVLYGLIFNGRNAYANKYRAIITDLVSEKERLEEKKVLLQKLSIMDGGEIMYDFNFANFDYTDHTNKVQYIFGANALTSCREDLTNTESVQMFYPVGHTRSQEMDYADGFKEIERKIKAGIVNGIKAHIPDFTWEANAVTGCDMYDKLIKYFAFFRRFDTDPDDLFSSPFARVSPCDKGFADNIIFDGYYMSPNISFGGGDSGDLIKLLRKHHWDWNIEWQPKDMTQHPFNKPLELPDGSGGTKVAPKKKILQELFMQCYDGSDIIDKDLLDPAITPAFLLLGEGYPVAVQEVMDQFVRYQEGRISFEGSRPDCVYIRTPECTPEYSTMDNIIKWKEGWQISRAGLANNTNTWALIGYGTLIEPDTDTPVNWSPTYNWVTGGSLLSYLVTGVSDSFASGAWSKVVGWLPGSARCIPRTSLEKEKLARNSINYLVQKSDRQFYLGEDHTVLDGKMSGLKNLGSMIQFGYITCYAYITLRDNKIMNLTADNLLELKEKVSRNISYYAKHFNNKIDIAIGRSTHEKEIKRDVVLCTIGITTHNFSRHSRLQMEALPSDE